MERFYIVFEGRVQGVGFRFFCQYNAISLGLTGFVHNMTNGMVEMQVQGNKDILEKFLSTIIKGNKFIRIDNYSTKKVSIVQDEKTFKIQ